ncbi:MAG: hypothetical protein ACE5RJ_01870 [Nitrosopumilaceae archaeon]
MNSNIIWFAIVSTIVLLSGVTGITLYQDVFAGKGDKVDVCHKGKTITVDPSSVQKHIDHGDTEGACGEPPQEGTFLECECGNGEIVSECFENSAALCDPSNINAQLARCNNVLCADKQGNASTEPVCLVNACTP